MRNEKDVREWVRSLGLPLVWTEAARGGTEGCSDVCIFLPHGYVVPMELKFWNMLQRDPPTFASRMRPAQVAYHHRMLKHGVNTLILWGTPGSDFLFAIGNGKCPRKVNDRVLLSDAKSYERFSQMDAFIDDLRQLRHW